MRNTIFFLLSFAILFLTACKGPEPEDPTTLPGKLSIKMQHKVGSEMLNPDGVARYLNASGETYSVGKFDYYLSNIVLVKSDGSEYVYPKDKSIFLLKTEDAASLTFELNDVPAAEYKGIRFVVGLDSATNMGTSHEGILDPANGMYWTWNTGHIFLKFEGNRSDGLAFEYHIAGSGGTESMPAGNNVKTVSLNFSPSTLNKSTARTLTLSADANKIFDGMTTISIQNYQTVTSVNAQAGRIAGNYAEMFKVESIQ